MSQAIDDRDYFTDRSVLADPYTYFAAIRDAGPIFRWEKRDLIFVTGHDEAVEVLRDSKTFSSCIAPAGPLADLPFEPEGDDIEEQIGRHRSQMTGSDMLPANDGARHSALRSLINRLFTPKRIKEIEENMVPMAEDFASNVASQTNCDAIKEIATPFVTLVIADLLGVPDEDRKMFTEVINAGPPPFDIETAASGEQPTPSPFMITMGTHFYNYIMTRRQNPTDDILSQLAHAKLPDGSTPSEIDVVKMVMFLFGAGQDTTGKLIGNSLRFLAENQEMQEKLRNDYSLIPPFIEEMLRIEGSVKATFRLAKKTTTVAGMTIPAGKKVVVFLAAGNHDPERWDSPEEFIMNRKDNNRHLAFGQGLHTCLGAPLARSEARTMLEKLFDKTNNFKLSSAHYGDTDKAEMDYEASFLIRGLNTLYLDFS